MLCTMVYVESPSVVVLELHSEFLTSLFLVADIPTGCLIIDHVLKQILPSGHEVPSSFETIVKYSNYVVASLANFLFAFPYFCFSLK